MTHLDQAILDLFFNMIKSWDKITRICYGVIEFDNGLSIIAETRSGGLKENTTLKFNEILFNLNENSYYQLRHVENPNTDKFTFYINTPYRQYAVPEIVDRHTYAEVLDTLDNSLLKFEEKKLKEYSEYFDYE